MTDINLASFIWSVADLLRGDYKQFENGRVILPVQATEPPERLSDGR
jgi:type I restriction-modification system DNA methylase subunit